MTDEHDDDTGGAGDEPITAAQFAALTEGLDELREGLAELREARTPAARQDAAADVEDAKRDLDALARSAGIPRAKLDAAIADAKRAETREQLRPILRELLDELRADDDDDDGQGDDAGKTKPKPKPAATSSTSASDDSTDGDTPPAGGGHWSERPLRELIR